MYHIFYSEFDVDLVLKRRNAPEEVVSSGAPTNVIVVACCLLLVVVVAFQKNLFNNKNFIAVVLFLGFVLDCAQATRMLIVEQIYCDIIQIKNVSSSTRTLRVHLPEHRPQALFSFDFSKNYLILF